MRPITTHVDTTLYSKQTQLDRVVLEIAVNTGVTGRKRRRPIESSVGAKVRELEQLLVDSWSPDKQWDSEANRLKAQRLKTKIGTG